MVSALMLRASSDVLDKARSEIEIIGYTPTQLSSELGLAVQLVENFLNGEIVDRGTYDLVCEKLNINLNPPLQTVEENIEELNPSITNQNESINKSDRVFSVYEAAALLNRNNSESSIDINQNLVESEPVNHQFNVDEYLQSFRNLLASPISRQCDRLRVVDVSTPYHLHDLYTDVNVFTSLQSSQYLDLNEAFENLPPEQYDRFYLAKLQPSTITANTALEKHKLLLLVGSLGSGKTTLLKNWALSCIEGKVFPNYLPVFLPLRSLISFDDLDKQNSSLSTPLSWLRKQIINYGLSDDLADNSVLEELLDKGRFLLLWDGLDEVPEIHRGSIAQQILSFSDLYPDNRMVCATRNPIFAHIIESFQTLEIAPFQESQITSFAEKWFYITCPQKSKKLEKFQQLLATNLPLAEIASNPLFLTYICNIFNSCEYLKPNFYQEILTLLLAKWEQTKCLPKDTNLTSELSISQKQDLLSYVAIVSLDRHGYVWQNNELGDDFQACITTSQTLSHLEIDRDRLFQMLKWQHSLLVECAKGVYCLTHTTLHDYLAAYRIAHSNPIAAETYLLDRMYLNRWHGVIVMTVSISQQADRMLQLMKRKIDELVIKDPHLQSFLSWVNQQSIQIKTPYKAVTIRALYLDIDLENTRSLDRARALDIAHSRSLERARSKAMGIDTDMETDVDIDYTINLALNLDLALYFANHPVLELACTLEPDLRKGLQFLRQKFPDPSKDRETFAKWWQSKGLDWAKKLRALIVHHRKGSQEWQFSENQLKVLRTYHDANKLLIECLNNAEYVSPLIKNQIESTLLSPQGEYSILQY